MVDFVRKLTPGRQPKRPNRADIAVLRGGQDCEAGAKYRSRSQVSLRCGCRLVGSKLRAEQFGYQVAMRLWKPTHSGPGVTRRGV
jgi:hypothetical protein